TCLIGLIILSGFVLNYVLSSLRLPQALAEMVKAFALPPWGVMLIIIGFYMALGTFMEGFSMIITTLPVVFPVVIALGYDPIWFGVVITLLIEIAMISLHDARPRLPSWGAAREQRHVLRVPRAEGGAHRPHHHRRVPRRPRDPPHPDAQALRPLVGEAGDARGALPPRRGRRARRRPRHDPQAARSRGRRARARPPPRREDRGAGRLPHPLLRQSRPRAAHRRDRAEEGARPHAVGERRRPARDPRVRAHVDDRHQRVRDADRPSLSGHAARRPRRRRRQGAAHDHAVERRPHDRRGGGRETRTRHRVGTGRRRR